MGMWRDANGEGAWGMGFHAIILCQGLRARCNDYRNLLSGKGVEYLTGEIPVREALGDH